MLPCGQVHHCYRRVLLERSRGGRWHLGDFAGPGHFPALLVEVGGDSFRAGEGSPAQRGDDRTVLMRAQY